VTVGSGGNVTLSTFDIIYNVLDSNNIPVFTTVAGDAILILNSISVSV
jgi:hypothetical protein